MNKLFQEAQIRQNILHKLTKELLLQYNSNMVQTRNLSYAYYKQFLQILEDLYDFNQFLRDNNLFEDDILELKKAEIYDDLRHILMQHIHRKPLHVISFTEKSLIYDFIRFT